MGGTSLSGAKSVPHELMEGKNRSSNPNGFQHLFPLTLALSPEGRGDKKGRKGWHVPERSEGRGRRPVHVLHFSGYATQMQF